MEAPKRRKTVVAGEGSNGAQRTLESVVHGAKGGEPKQQRTVEQVYQKKSQLEHILLRPDSYVGSVERQSQDHWVFDADAGHMTKRKLEYVPALYKIFDEILVNAADNLVRDPTQDTIRIDIRKKEGTISVYNNGRGLPVQMHKEHKCYVPELVFGQLLTSDNYDDSERKVTGGRNGYGAKLTNIFSSRFVVETVDSGSKKAYKQVWEKNMGVVNKPEISAMAQGDEDFTQVTFKPDLSRFSMNKLEDDIVDLMARRAYDVAASTHGRCKVFLNGKQLSVAAFEDYVSLYLGEDAFKVCQSVNDRWEVAIGLTDGSGFQQVSFVNSISTSRGGTHVDYVANQLVGAVLERVNKQKGGGLAVKAQHVRGYLWVFVNCLIENPAFDSQTKETLTVKKEKFGSQCELPGDMVTAVLESGILESLQEWSKAMGKSELAQHLNRSDLGMQKRIFGIPKLEDANKAGTKESADCTLILTEGDSAKALAVAGLSVVGRDHFGVFPLRGKLRNVRELSVKQLMENREIDQVMRIMALDASKEYLDRKGLRYGSIMIMTDQDYDGSHIKGLIINFIQHWFPTLMKVPGFLKEFVTPIVKVTKGDVTHTFFTIPEYSRWKEENNDGQGWKCKYYKGLGTSTSKEAKDYFAEMQDHEIHFTHDGLEADDLVDMAFNPKRADDRKTWISQVDENTFVDHSEAELSYSDFINKELSLFAKYDVERAIPSMVDGFKPGQRKVLFGCFKKKCKDDIKVAQLSGYVAEHSAYHHGESSLQGTIIGMAQTFVGANNVNLLMPVGQFGTRLQGGKDHAASRYIFTKLSKVARCVFPEQDDAVLEYQVEEGLSIEPKWYCPVIPMVLVNGADGIGTGWSTSVPNYSPREVIARVRAAMRGEALDPLVPWYRGFKGAITPIEGTKGRFEVTGVATKRGSTRVEITELPVRKWTQDYKDWLLEQLPSGSEQRAFVTEVREHHTENSVHFVVSMTPDKLADAESGKGLEKTFHLRSTLSNTNMWLFDHEGRIKKYDTPEAVIHDFMPVRLQVYEKRKANMIQKMERELGVISNKYKFVYLVVTDQLDVENRKSALLCAAMRKHGLQWMCEIEARGNSVDRLSPAEEMGPQGFKYLVSMKMWSLTEERLEELRRQQDEVTAKLDELRKRPIEALWESDLQKLEEALDAAERELRKEEEAAAKLAMKKVDETFLENTQCVIALSRNLTAKRLRASVWKAHKKGGRLGGGKGKGLVENKAVKDKEDGGEEEGEEEEGEDEVEKTSDALSTVFCCRDFDKLLVFTEDGLVYLLQALDVPLAKKMSAPGTPLKDIIPALGDKGNIAALTTIPQGRLKDQTDDFIILVSKFGMAKKVMLDRFRGLRPGKGVPAMRLGQGDKLGWAHRASTNCALVLVTAQGFCLRIPMGDDWKPGTPQGPGKPAMRVRPGSGDYIAGSSLSEVTEAEVQREKDAKEAAEKRRLAVMEAAALLAKEGPASETAAAAVAAATAATAKPTRPANTCDDDDSDNGAADTAAPATAPSSAVTPAAATALAAQAVVPADALAKAGAGSEDGDSDAGNKDGDDDDENENEAAGEAQEGTGGESSCSALIVTAQGMALRIPLSHKRFKLAKKGRRGMRTMRIGANDVVVGMVVVSSTAEGSNKARKALLLYFDDVKGELDDADRGFNALHIVRKWWQELPPEKQQVYIDRENEELQKLSKVEQVIVSEEILLGSQKGFVNRVKVGTIGTQSGCSKGRSIAKLKGGDKICSVSLLSSKDADPEQDAEASNKLPQAKPPAPAVKRARPKEAPQREPDAQQSAVPASSSRETSGPTLASFFTPPPPAPAAAAAAPAPAPAAAPLGSPRMAAAAGALEPQGLLRTSVGYSPAMSPFGVRGAPARAGAGEPREPAEPRRLSTGSNKRLRGKQSALPSPMVALRRRVSHMASPLLAHSRSFSKEALNARRNAILRRKGSGRVTRQLSWDVSRPEAAAEDALRDGGAATSPPVPLHRVTWDLEEMARAAKANRSK